MIDTTILGILLGRRDQMIGTTCGKSVKTYQISIKTYIGATFVARVVDAVRSWMYVETGRLTLPKSKAMSCGPINWYPG